MDELPACETKYTDFLDDGCLLLEKPHINVGLRILMVGWTARREINRAIILIITKSLENIILRLLYTIVLVIGSSGSPNRVTPSR